MSYFQTSVLASLPRLLASSLLALLLVAGLAACAERSETTSGADTTGSADVTGTLQSERPSARGDSVTVQSTIGLLRGSVQAVAINRAVQNLNGWQTQLEGTEYSDLSDQLEALKQELVASDQLQAQSVGQKLVALGERTAQAASGASGQTATQLRQLAQTLQQAGEELTGV